MVRQAVFWSFGSQCLTFVVQFGTAIVIAKLLSPREVGVYAIAIAITSIIQLFGAFSVGSYVIREKDLTPDTLGTAFTINAIVSVLLSLTIYVASLFGAVVMGDPAVTKVVRLLALLPILSIVSFIPGILLQRAMNMSGISILATLAALVNSGVTIGCAYEGLSSMSPAYGGVASTLVTTVGTMIVGRAHIRVRVSLRAWRPMTVFGLRLMSVGGVGALAARVCDLALGYFLGLAALGLYSRASNLNNILFANVYGAAVRVVFAKLSETKRSGGHVGSVFFHGYRLIAGVMAPLLIGLAILSGPAVHILYGSKWSGVALPLSLLLIGQFIAMTFAMNWELFVLRDELKTQTRLELLRTVAASGLRIAASVVSVAAVGAVSVVESALSLLLYQRHMPRLAGVPANTFYRAYAEMTALGLIAALPSLVLMLVTRWDPATSLGLILPAIGLGAVLWLVALYRLRHPLCVEIGLALGKVGRMVASAR